MINTVDFRGLVIRPALALLAPVGIPVTDVAENLLLATAAVETGIGTWLAQQSGPAVGVFQIEPASLVQLGMSLSAAEANALRSVTAPLPALSVQLNTNLLAAAVVCRLFYWHETSMPLPPNTKAGLWNYYKTYYNTPAGAATEAGFMQALMLTDLGSLP